MFDEKLIEVQNREYELSMEADAKKKEIKENNKRVEMDHLVFNSRLEKRNRFRESIINQIQTIRRKIPPLLFQNREEKEMLSILMVIETILENWFDEKKEEDESLLMAGYISKMEDIMTEECFVNEMNEKIKKKKKYRINMDDSFFDLNRNENLYLISLFVENILDKND